MTIDNLRLEELAQFLTDYLPFRKRIAQLKHTPFLIPEPGSPFTLKGAGARKTPYLQIAIGALICLLLIACAYMFHHINSAELKDIPSFRGFLALLFNAAPEYAIFAVAGVALVALGLALFFFKVPVHVPDPLFGRLLQERVQSAEPLSAMVITNLLADRRFVRVFHCAAEVIFPIEPIFDENRPDTVPVDWPPFISRLVTFVGSDDHFIKFFANHRETDLEKLYNSGLLSHLEYGARSLLFSEILDDPDCAYIYRDTLHLWRKIVEWFSTFDMEKATKFLRSDKESSTKPGPAQGTINAALAGLGLFLLLQLLRPTPAVNIALPPEGNDGQELARLSQVISDLAAKSTTCPCPPPPETQQPSPVYITMPPITEPQINLPATTVNVPLPPTINAVVTSTVKSTEAVSVSGLDPAPMRDPGYVLSQPPLPDKPSSPAVRKVGGDDFVTLAPGQPTNLTLHTELGQTCTYSIAFKKDSRWLPDPVEVEVQSADTNNSVACPILPNQQYQPINFNVISAGRDPLYSELLHAYVSVDETHKRRLHLFSKNLIVLRVHYQAEPS